MQTLEDAHEALPEEVPPSTSASVSEERPAADVISASLEATTAPASAEDGVPAVCVEAVDNANLVVSSETVVSTRVPRLSPTKLLLESKMKASHQRMPNPTAPPPSCPSPPSSKTVLREKIERLALNGETPPTAPLFSFHMETARARSFTKDVLLRKIEVQRLGGLPTAPHGNVLRELSSNGSSVHTRSSASSGREKTPSAPPMGSKDALQFKMHSRALRRAAIPVP